MNSMNEEVEGVDVLVEGNVRHPGVFSMKHPSMVGILIEAKEKDPKKEIHPKLDVSYVRIELHRLVVGIISPWNIGGRDQPPRGKCSILQKGVFKKSQVPLRSH